MDSLTISYDLLDKKYETENVTKIKNFDTP